MFRELNSHRIFQFLRVLCASALKNSRSETQRAQRTQISVKKKCYINLWPHRRIYVENNSGIVEFYFVFDYFKKT